MAAAGGSGRDHPGIDRGACHRIFQRACRSERHHCQGVFRDAVPFIWYGHRDHLHATVVCGCRGVLPGEETYAMIVPLAHVLLLAAVLFGLGLICALVWRSNVIMLLIGIEIMLNAAMLVFV